VPTFEERFAAEIGKLDFAKIEFAILGNLKMTDYDLLDAKACVFAGLERWLVQDLDNFEITQLEGKITVPHEWGGEKFKAYLDIRGTMTGVAKEFTAYKNKRFIVDWKTARGALDKKWFNRQVLSQQWRQYVWAEEEKPSLFMYRGIRRPAAIGESPELREIIIDPQEYTQNNQELTQIQIDGILTMREALMSAGYLIWPRNMPEACYAFNQECPYLHDCDTGSIPKWLPPAGKVMSYSRLKTFQSCPERSRRDLMPSTEEDPGGSDATRFGAAVHRGLAEAYSQAFNTPVLTREEQELETE
jgi:hypothetical protein